MGKVLAKESLHPYVVGDLQYVHLTGFMGCLTNAHWIPEEVAAEEGHFGQVEVVYEAATGAGIPVAGVLQSSKTHRLAIVTA